MCVIHHTSDQWSIKAKLILEEVGSHDAKLDLNEHEEERG